jgi:PAS domain S-box-containing protein
VHVNAAPILDATDSLAGAVRNREAAAQRQAERAMREAYSELDERVVRRTAALERASAALRERNALLNAITTSTPDLIFAKDREGRMLMANPAWLKAVGRAEGDEMRDPMRDEPRDTVGLNENERLVLESGETMTLEEIMADRTYLASKAPLRQLFAKRVGYLTAAAVSLRLPRY